MQHSVDARFSSKLSALAGKLEALEPMLATGSPDRWRNGVTLEAMVRGFSAGIVDGSSAMRLDVPVELTGPQSHGVLVLEHAVLVRGLADLVRRSPGRPADAMVVIAADANGVTVQLGEERLELAWLGLGVRRPLALRRPAAGVGGGAFAHAVEVALSADDRFARVQVFDGVVRVAAAPAGADTVGAKANWVLRTVAGAVVDAERLRAIAELLRSAPTVTIGWERDGDAGLLSIDGRGAAAVLSAAA